MRIELRDTAKHFGRVVALRGVSLEIPRGRRVALVGPNGSGKSTLIRALLGLIACEGRCLIDGRAPYEDRVALAKRLAYVPQVAPALGASVGEIVAMVCLTRGLATDALAAMASELDLDLAAVSRRPFRYLSGGMKQKVLLTIAFAARPELLVMDEPTASLDARTRERFFELCAALPATTTVLLCSHRIDELSQLVDHVAELEEGRLVYDGPVPAYLERARSASRASAVERIGGVA